MPAAGVPAGAGPVVHDHTERLRPRTGLDRRRSRRHPPACQHRRGGPGHGARLRAGAHVTQRVLARLGRRWSWQPLRYTPRRGPGVSPVSLPRRPLGGSGLEITTVGFGSWAIGGGGWAFGWGPQDDDASLDAIQHAVDLGVNWIDTAAIYGLGHAEEVVGRAVRALPAADRPLVFTKCGLVWDEADRLKARPQRSSRATTVRDGIEASLRRLRHGLRRPLPDPLARRGGQPHRGGLGRDGQAPRRGQGARRRRLQLRPGPARTLRGRSGTSTRCSRRSRSIDREAAARADPVGAQHAPA